MMAITPAEIAQIQAYFEERRISYDADTLLRFDLYHTLILSRSARMNLVSRNDLKNLVPNHILDSLDPIALIPVTGNILDVGSGAGFPAIPLAIVRPKVCFSLLESVHKKILFLHLAKEKLGLANVEILEMRLEDLSEKDKFGLATVRALPKWEKLLGRIKEHVRPGGKVILYEKRGLFRTIGV